MTVPCVAIRVIAFCIHCVQKASTHANRKRSSQIVIYSWRAAQGIGASFVCCEGSFMLFKPCHVATAINSPRELQSGPCIAWLIQSWLKTETRNPHRVRMPHSTPHTGLKCSKLTAGLKHSYSRLYAVNLLCLSPVCGYVRNMFQTYISAAAGVLCLTVYIRYAATT